MSKFNFYRVGGAWAMKLDPQVDSTSEQPITLFKDSITDDDVTTLALLLAKGDNITVNVNFSEDKGSLDD